MADRPARTRRNNSDRRSSALHRGRHLSTDGRVDPDGDAGGNLMKRAAFLASIVERVVTLRK
jgi:hypothetical protein